MRALAAAAVAMPLIAGVWALGLRAQVPPLPAGDQLGMEAGESWDTYRGRATASLSDAPADQPVFALVTFSPALDPVAASAALDEVRRVDAVVFRGAPPRALPEPTAGQSRAAVFATAAQRAGVDELIDGVVVHESGARLRVLAGAQPVAAVEALPPDAVWGAFGIAPIRRTGAAAGV